MVRCRPIRALALAAVLAATLPAAGCTPLDNFLASIPIFSFLRESPAYDPYEMPRPAPELSVPYASPAGKVLPPIPETDSAFRAFAAEVDNPLPPAPAVLERGQILYMRFCYVCHGVRGEGNGPVTDPGELPFAADLTSEAARALPGGYIYAIIREGRGLMPSYGQRVAHLERWAIVWYVRKLQGRLEEMRQTAAVPEEEGPEEG